MQNILVIAGPTASGKSAVAVKIAQKRPSVIINCDSSQLYSGLDILTAQPSKEEFSLYDHRLYKILEPYEHFSVADYKNRAEAEIAKVLEEGKLPIIVGGTGLYINALIDGISKIPDVPLEIREEVRELFDKLGNEKFFALLNNSDPIAGSKLHVGDSQRIKRAYEVYLASGTSIYILQQNKMPNTFKGEQYKVIKLLPDRDILYNKINARFDYMIEQGAIGELKSLINRYDKIDDSLLKASGVPELLLYIYGEISLEKAVDLAKQKTRNYAKRQCTWFRNKLEGAEVNSAAINFVYDIALTQLL
jgi:tRNA dimethylallyltransferase